VEVHRHLTGEDLHPHHEEVHHAIILLAMRTILDGVDHLVLLVLVLRLGLLVVEVGVVAVVIRTLLVVPPVPPRRLIVAAVTGVAVDPGAAIVIVHAVPDAGAAVPRGVRPRGRRIPIRMTREVRLPTEAAALRPRVLVVVVVPNQKQRPKKTFTPRINVPCL
jgi:hypothetical protein